MRRQFKQKTLAQWEKELISHDVCWGAVRTLDEALASTLFKEREMVVEIEEKDGKKLKVLGTPVKMSDTPGSIRTSPPSFGEDTNQVLKGFGYSDEQLKKFSEEGII